MAIYNIVIFYMSYWLLVYNQIFTSLKWYYNYTQEDVFVTTSMLLIIIIYLYQQKQNNYILTAEHFVISIFPIIAR